MSLKQSDIIFIRSLPYPRTQEQVPQALLQFTKIIFTPLRDIDKFIKILRKAIDAGMILPAYIRPLTEKEIDLAHAGAQLTIDADESEEKKKELDALSESERATMKYLLFIERLYS